MLRERAQPAINLVAAYARVYYAKVLFCLNLMQIMAHQLPDRARADIQQCVMSSD